MLKQSIKNIVLSAAAAGVVGWVAAPHIANAANAEGFGGNPTNVTQTASNASGSKTVRFFAIVNNDGCFLDTQTSGTTAFTSFQLDGLVKCHLTEGTFRSKLGASSPLTSPTDDLVYTCPSNWINNGEGMQWGVGVTN